MLLRFQFTNYASYRDPQTISWVATSLKHSYRIPLEQPGVEHGVLPCIAIYGANASGKSNALQALIFFFLAIQRSFRDWMPEATIPRNQFQRAKTTPNPESKFELDFAIEGVRYQYGFAISDEEVTQEWLYAYPTARKQLWFERKAGKGIEFGKSLKGQHRSIEELTRRNVLFLSVAALHGHSQLTAVHSWLSKCLTFNLSERPIGLSSTASIVDKMAEGQFLHLIQAADLGIVGMNVKRIHPDFTTARPTSAYDLATNSATPSSTESRVLLLHQIEGQAIEFDEERESDGTRVYLSRLPSLLKVLRDGGVYMVDEIDRSLHPALCLQIVKLFLSQETNPKGAQILFTTHDSSLLSSGDLRRDEVWFAEKRPDGASELYPLSDFSPRKNENLERGYLQGRYGGVPIINESSFWTAFEANPADAQS